MSQPDQDRLRALDTAISKTRLSVTTLAKDDPLRDAYDMWLHINDQRYGITFDKSELLALLAREVRLGQRDELKRSKLQGYIVGPKMERVNRRIAELSKENKDE